MTEPGIIVYFELIEPLQQFSDAERGRLFMAMLEYGRDGIEPQFEGRLAMAWGFIRPKLERNKEAYQKTVLQRRYAASCRDRKNRGEEKISFEQWLIQEGESASSVIT